MKKLFTIIAVASMMLTTVGFTSCQKDELPAPAPQTVTTNNNGNNGQSVTITSVNSQYDNNGGTIINTNTKETAAEADPFTNMSGTWEYVDADGIKCTLVFSNEGKSTLPQKFECDGKMYMSSAKYDVELTIGDKKYTGKFMSGRFGTQTDGGAYVVMAEKYASSASANSFSADIKVAGNLTAQGITLTRVK